MLTASCIFISVCLHKLLHTVHRNYMRIYYTPVAATLFSYCCYCSNSNFQMP